MMSPEEEEERRKAMAASRPGSNPTPAPTPNIPAEQQPGPATFTPSTVSGANFDLSNGAKQQINQAQNDADAINQKIAARVAGGGSGIPAPDEIAGVMKAADDRTNAVADDQARRANVDTADAVTGAQGIAGFFGAKDSTKHFTAAVQQDTTTAGNKAKLDALSASIASRPDAQMAGTQLDAGQSNEVRGRQLSLADALAASAAGNGPSAARATLQAGSDQAMSDALSLARSGSGNPGLALKQALAAQGKIGQQTANQAAVIKAQEQQTAIGQLGQVLDTSRGQDLGAATTNANLAQSTGATNLQASIQQQQFKDKMIADLQAKGMTLDEAQREYQLKQSQFNAQLLAQQAAADKGVAMQSAASGGQVVGAGIGAAAALGASLAAA